MTYSPEQGDSGVSANINRSFDSPIQFGAVMNSNDFKDFVDKFKQGSSVPPAFEGPNDCEITFDTEHANHRTNERSRLGSFLTEIPDDNRPRSAAESGRATHEAENGKPPDQTPNARPQSQPLEHSNQTPSPKQVDDIVGPYVKDLVEKIVPSLFGFGGAQQKPTEQAPPPHPKLEQAPPPHPKPSFKPVLGTSGFLLNNASVKPYGTKD